MALNLEALKNADKNLSAGNNDYFNAKEIGEDTIIRILPPGPELNGLYYFEQSIYWIANKPYVSPSTFGDRCIIEEFLADVDSELQAQKKKGKVDKELQGLYDAIVKPKKTFIFPMLHLNCGYDEDGAVESVEVIGGKYKVMQCGPQLIGAINKQILAPKIMRKLKNVEDGVMDRVEGFNLSLSKTGSGLSTEYSAAVDEPCEIEEKYYKSIPNMIELSKKGCYTDEYLEGILNQYFYGDAAPSADLKKSRYQSEESEKQEEKPTRTSKTEKESVKEEVEEETPKRRTNTRSRFTEEKEKQSEEKPKESKSSGSIVDDLESLDD